MCYMGILNRESMLTFYKRLFYNGDEVSRYAAK